MTSSINSENRRLANATWRRRCFAIACDGSLACSVNTNGSPAPGMNTSCWTAATTSINAAGAARRVQRAELRPFPDDSEREGKPNELESGTSRQAANRSNANAAAGRASRTHCPRLPRPAPSARSWTAASRDVALCVFAPWLMRRSEALRSAHSEPGVPAASPAM